MRRSIVLLAVAALLGTLMAPAQAAGSIASVHTYGTLGPPRSWYGQADYRFSGTATMTTWLRLYQRAPFDHKADLAPRQSTNTSPRGRTSLITQRSNYLQLGANECVQALSLIQWSGGYETRAGELYCP